MNRKRPLLTHPLQMETPQVRHFSEEDVKCMPRMTHSTGEAVTEAELASDKATCRKDWYPQHALARACMSDGSDVIGISSASAVPCSPERAAPSCSYTCSSSSISIG